MGDDISRSTFNPSKRYSAVRQQQGRVNLDADWNEQIDIAAYRLGTEIRDVVGLSGVPRDNAGFAISAPGTGASFASNDLTISPGRMYVAGRLCELASTLVNIENFSGDGTGAAGTQVQLASVVLDGSALEPGQWVQLSAQGSPPPAPQMAQVTSVNAAAGSVTFSSSVSSFGSPNTSPQLQRVTTYLTQPDYPAPTPLPIAGNALVYLEMWERTITALEDPGIQEVALGGPDTATRTKTVWQLKVLPLPAGVSSTCSTPDSAIAAWQTIVQPSGGLLTNGVIPSSASAPCSITTGSGFTGMENQLYRVEIHQSGTLSAAAGPLAYPVAPGTATFKWSRDNASVATGVTAIVASASSAGISTSQLTVQSTGRDAVLSFSPQDWIEITDDFLDLSRLPGELHQIDSNGVDQTRCTITLATSVSTALLTRLTASTNYHTRICRWDHSGQVLQAGTGSLWVDLNAAGSTGDIPVPPPGISLVLENGITVAFGLRSSTLSLNTGDSWKFAARTADGSVESIVQAPPSGNQHQYCRVATISFDAKPSWAISDCRKMFAPLADPGIHVAAVSLTGSGQSLLNDSTVTVQQLASGISVACDGALDAASVNQPNNVQTGNTLPVSSAQASCFVSVGLPLVSGASIVGFQSLTLGATVSLDTSQTTIQWLPATGVISGLATQMTTVATQTSLPGTPPIVPTLLAHLTLKGNDIWALDDPNTYLDGEALGSPYLDAAGVQHTGLLLPSGDGNRGGDFSMWFWLTSPPAPPPLTLSTTTLTFIPTPLNVPSLPLSVTINNTTGAALPVMIGTTGDFSETNTCGTTLAASASCTINIVFMPIQQGSRSGQLNVSSGNTQLAVALSGTGVPFQLSALPTTIDFGGQLVGSTGTPQTVTLTNNGVASTPIVITGIGTASANYPHSTSCSTLSAGQSCTITIQFSPQAVGAQPDALTVNTIPPGLLARIPLAGTGIQPKNQTKDTKDAKTFSDNKDIKDKPKGHLEQIVRPIATLVPGQAERPIEEEVTGRAFIQAEERPAVGQQVLEEPSK